MHQSLQTKSAVRRESIHAYGDAERPSGIASTQSYSDRIIIKFKTGRHYLYTHASTGAHKVETMKQLATQGRGLQSYINREVGDLFADSW